MDLLLMCLEFFKTGLLSVGGGLATLPFLYSMADRYPWFDRAQLSDMIAVSESTPGPMGVNMATYAGFTAHGIVGALLATLSLVLPSIIVILIVARFLHRFQTSKAVQRVLSGLRPASVGLIAAAGFGILKIALNYSPNVGALDAISWKALILMIVIGVLYRWKQKWHPIIFIALGADSGGSGQRSDAALWGDYHPGGHGFSPAAPAHIRRYDRAAESAEARCGLH